MSIEDKSIQISYKADIKDLQQKLAQIPNITGEEAKKMVSALDRQLKQAESSAKKAAEATKKAAQSAGHTAEKAERQFDHLADAAQRSGSKIEMMAEKSGDLDRGFSSVGMALRGVNPQLAEAADGLADTFAVGEGLLLTFKSLNPMVLAGAVAIGTLTLGYTAYKASVEAANQAILAQKEAMKSLHEILQDQKNNFYAANDAINGMRQQLALARGEISQYEYDRSKAAQDAGAQFDVYTNKQEEIIAQRKEERDLIKSIREGNTLLSEDEKNRLKNLQLITPGVSKTKDLLDGSAEASGALYKIEQALNDNIQKQNIGLDRLKTQREEAVTISKQLVDIAESERVEKAAQSKTEKNITAEKVDQKDLEEERLKAIEASLAEDAKNQEIRKGHLDELQSIIDANILDEDQKKEQAYQRELERIDELARMTGDDGLARMALWAKENKMRETAQEEITKIVNAATQTEAEKREEVYQQQIERIKELAKITQDNNAANIAMIELEHAKRKEMMEDMITQGLDVSGQMTSMAKTLSELNDQRMQSIIVDQEAQKQKAEELAKMSTQEREAYEQKKKFAMRLFRFEQASAISEIAFSTAKAIMEAMAYPPVLRAAMIASIAATGMAQTALVSGRQPPSFHTGGMAPDETSARLLKGEAVLDRATVRAIGGEQGVKNLQHNKTQDNVVVIQPFKHFGRFAKEIGFQAPKKTGIKV